MMSLQPFKSKVCTPPKADILSFSLKIDFSEEMRGFKIEIIKDEQIPPFSVLSSLRKRYL